MVAKPQIDIGEYQYGFRDVEDYVYKSERGLNREIVENISAMKGEPDWMRDFRLKALDHFDKRPMPNWGADLSGIDFDNIFYYIRPAEKLGRTWDEVPEYIKNTFEKLGIPEAERKFLAGVGAQYESEVIYHSLRAYFRINAENMGQFERTLIIVDKDAYVHYVEGCTAPTYSTSSLHSAVVEIVVLEDARCRYTTIQNWSKNVYNLVTKRAAAYKNATMEWVDGNLGSKVTMKYPAVWLMEEGARGQILSKSISKGTGRSSYRGLVKVYKGAEEVRSNVVCDALLLDETSKTDTYPYIEVEEERASIGHEATVSKVAEEQIFYLMSRGLTEDEAMSMIVNGFIEPIAKELPLEYAVELNRLIQLEMEGSVG